MKNTTKQKNPRKPSRDKNAWAYWMQAIEPKSEELNKAFPGYHPQWVQMSQMMTIGAANFMLMRLTLGITVEQCAAYLRVSTQTIGKWESDREPIPFAAFELMRVVIESVTFKLSHPEWTGWFIDLKNGKLVSPDEGKRSYAPDDLNMLTRAISEKSRLAGEVQRIKNELDAAVTENTRLRQMFLSQGVVDELAMMKDKLDKLMKNIGTAHIIPFASASEEQKKEKVA